MFALRQVRLSAIEQMELSEKGGQLVLRLTVHGEAARLLLRGREELRHWFGAIMVRY